MPEYLERVGKIEDALRVADKMLNAPMGERVARSNALNEKVR